METNRNPLELRVEFRNTVILAQAKYEPNAEVLKSLKFVHSDFGLIRDNRDCASITLVAFGKSVNRAYVFFCVPR